ncbi:unnamed protein product [Ectocarpus sp. 13 AM-2016]
MEAIATSDLGVATLYARSRHTRAYSLLLFPLSPLGLSSPTSPSWHTFLDPPLSVQDIRTHENETRRQEERRCTIRVDFQRSIDPSSPRCVGMVLVFPRSISLPPFILNRLPGKW